MLDEQPHLAHAVGDGVGVFDDHLARLFLAQVAEFFQHLIGGAEIERRLVVRVLKALGGHQNGAIRAIPRLHEVYVASGDHGLVQLLAQPHDFAVEIAQRFLILGRAFLQHKGVVADGLDFQIIVKARDAQKLRVPRAAHHRAEQFARLARAAHDQPFPVFFDQAARNARTAAVMVQVRLAHQAVEVGHARL